ncbi:MAG: molybdenum cofactor biosynthesis protein MoaE [Acetobacteraceae bacterium]|nr:molybdenum cofactor biosynthesis protein MoaE [Acetobacteraceae bacterium]MBV8577568.1 molybdenum cofactor biosynthesis protein MoaE [Acetobacteraceae bacterium]
MTGLTEPAPPARVRVQEQDFDVAAEMDRLTAGHAGVGGIGCFVGKVRDSSGGHPIESMELEHYPAMTIRELERIAAESMRRWSLLGCTVIHRVGQLRPGDNIVLVLAAAAHRQSALEATGFLIDWLKTRAPFWKKERFETGAEAWVEARAEDETAAARWQEPAPAGI